MNAINDIILLLLIHRNPCVGSRNEILLFNTQYLENWMVCK